MILSLLCRPKYLQNIRFFRLSSEMFPYASHANYGYSLEFCAPLLAKAGALARRYSHRLTTHPGQYTQLGSPKPAVVEAAVRDLEYHCQMFDLMNMGPDSVMVIHVSSLPTVFLLFLLLKYTSKGGGVYGDKATTLGRLKESIKALSPNVRNRLVLENDEVRHQEKILLSLS
jgi:UV DNA damage endonuclease